MNNLTAILISFLRPEYTIECVKSLQNQYKDINIIVGDNAGHNDELAGFCLQYGCKYVPLPFDSGVSIGRNRLIEHVDTEFILIGDDDFYYTEDAKVPEMLEFMRNHSEFDLIGGRVIERGVVKNYQGTIDIYPDHLHYHKLDFDQCELDEQTGLRYQKCDITFNYFIARTQVLKDNKWDENIKVAHEHSDYFIGLKKAGVRVAFTPDAVVVHKPEHVQVARQSEYKGYRSRRSDKDYFFTKHNLKYSIGLNGVRTNYNLDEKEKQQIYKQYGKVNAEHIQEVDICITTMERKKQLAHLVRSIFSSNHNYPVTIADQSASFDVEWYTSLWKELDYIVKPKAYYIKHDVGLSVARNYLVEKTTQPYLLFLEDDMIFSRSTNIKKLVGILKKNPEAGVVGGGLVQNGKLLHFEHYIKKIGQGLYHQNDGDHYFDVGDTRVKQTGCVFNFFVARREVFEDVQWDPAIKINGEHTDFFYRLSKTKWKVLYTPDVTITHDKVENHESYEQKRNRNHYIAAMLKKHQANEMVYQNGFSYYIKENGQIGSRRVEPAIPSYLNKK